MAMTSECRILALKVREIPTPTAIVAVKALTGRGPIRSTSAPATCRRRGSL